MDARVPIGLATRPDLQVVADLIEPGSRVLDIGCGNGELLAHLVEQMGVDGRGIEIRRAKVNRCVAAGLSVIRGNANTDLSLYPMESFDYVVLTQTLQAMEQPKQVLEELTRIGRRAIVSIPNFGFWRIRLNLLFGGRMPVTEKRDKPWYETQNIHPCTIQDFLDLAAAMQISVEEGIVLEAEGRRSRSHATTLRANLWGKQAIFLLKGSRA